MTVDFLLIPGHVLPVAHQEDVDRQQQHQVLRTDKNGTR